MFTHDIQQLAEETPSVALGDDPMDVHHALADARWVQNAYHQLRPQTFTHRTGRGSTPGLVVELSSIDEEIFPSLLEDSP
jgi:hypothetical protein